MDTHVHAASCMNHKHLLRFIKRKMKYNAEDFVMIHEGREITLREVNTDENLILFEFYSLEFRELKLTEVRQGSSPGFCFRELFF